MSRTFRALLAAGLAAAVSALALPAAAAQAGPAPALSLSPVPSFVRIPARDGVPLAADVFTPTPGTPGADGRGRYPVVVQPAAWGQPDLEYLAEARRLTERGYVVVTYTPRGFWLSGGQSDDAGPASVSDISAVIDWTLAHTPADPQRIGLLGLSLGAGLSLMGAASDPRIRAVAAMSAWGDLSSSLDGNGTRHLEAASALIAVGLPGGRPSPETRRIEESMLTGENMQAVDAWAHVRSPAAYLDRLNAHHTAVFIANAWGDSIFSSSQIVSFYQGLTVPKRLELRPGDHATQELTGLLGLDNQTWDDAEAWLDHYLRGGPDTGARVRLTVLPTGAQEDYDGWQSVSTGSQSVPLPGQRTVLGGVDSGADAGVVELSGLLDQIAKTPPTVWLPLLPRWAAAVWQTPAYPSGDRIRGIPRLRTTVTSTAPDGTAIAYLYDVDPLGIGKLITHAPQSWTGRSPGRPFPLDVDLYATAYDLPAGHHLALVIDTADPLYATRSPLGSRVTFGAPATAAQAVLTLPVRGG
jgi:predicted acyl esterase